MSLLNTKTGFTTPWHCSVALLADGEWLSAPMSEFKKDPMLEIVYEDGRPSYFQEKTRRLCEHNNAENGASNKQALKPLNGHSASVVSDKEVAADRLVGKADEKLQTQPYSPVSSHLDENKEKKITEPARKTSNHKIENENGEFTNPFFGSQNPSLDPKSGVFSSKLWLETLMSITSRDPERYPKRAAGLAYKNLSAHGFGEPTDYQKTFGNYPFELVNLAKRLIGNRRKTRIQILRDFEGLVRSGEMLVVLGRPGR